MTYQNLALEELVVNRDNDRHGPIGTEDDAIAWLLEKRADHMRRLALDIVDTAVAHQRQAGLIDDAYVEMLGKFQRSEELLSSSSMNKYVHSADLSPSGQHLCSVWDTLQRFLVNCVRA